MSGQEQEFKVRIAPRSENKNFHIMKFRSSNPQSDPSKWTQVRMVRENNKKEYKGREEDQPKFGAGSEYGREEREEARRKKYGYVSKKYDPDMQPWLMRIGGKRDGKHFRGQREGGVSDNTTYYVFTHAPDGSFEAHPIKEWYNFTPRIAYQTLDAEEAEEKFAQRGKILNHWAVMLSKKLKPDQDDDDDLDDEDGKKGKKKGGKKADKDFKISDMDDDWGGSGDELDSESDDEDGEKKKKKSNDSDDEGGKKKSNKKKKSKEDVNDEAFEDSDDGEGEGREVDYMSDESSEEEEVEADKHDIKGVDMDEGLSKMLDSDESDEEEGEKKENEEDEDNEDKKKEDGKKSAKSSANNSRSGSPAPDAKGDEKSSKAEKRKAMVDKLLDPNAESLSKRGRFEAGSSASQPASNSMEASLEEDVRRYLARKPMTTTEIVRKMTQKKTGLSKEELMPLLGNVIRRINPHKQKVKGTMYLSLKTGK